MIEFEAENEVPIDDEFVVLDLLWSDWGYRTVPKTLWHHQRLYREPVVTIDYDFGERYYFVVSKVVVEKLVENMWIEGQKHWGYTDMKELSISESGKWVLYHRWGEIGARPCVEPYRPLRSEDWFREFSTKKTGRTP